MNNESNLPPPWLDEEDEGEWEEIMRMEAEFERRMRIRRAVIIAAVVLVVGIIGTFAALEFTGYRFNERLAVHDGGLSTHKDRQHESHPEKYVCGGELLATDDYDFFMRTFTYPDGYVTIAEEVRAVKKAGFMYREVKAVSRELLYDVNNEPVFNMTRFRGEDTDYYFITHVRRQPTVNDDGSVTVNICHVSPTIIVNGQTVELEMYSFFAWSGQIDTIQIDGVTIDYQSCKRNDPVFYLDPVVTVPVVTKPDDEPGSVTEPRTEEPTEIPDEETEPDNPWAADTEPDWF